MEWTLVNHKIKDLKPHPRNPRKLSSQQAAQIKRSIEKFGLVEKVIINTDLMIIGGHQRLKVLKKLGIKEVECWVPSQQFTPEQVDELNIRLNRNTGEWDYDSLANEWEISNLLEWGFEPGDFDLPADMLSTEEDSEQPLEPPSKPKTKIGDLYELGPHRLICGDSTSSDCVDRLLGGALPVLMVTDPPYGVEYNAKWREGRGGKWGKLTNSVGRVQNDDRIDWSLSLGLFPGSIAYIWHAAWYSADVQKVLQSISFEVVSQIIWAKQHFTISRGDYHWQHEPCWYALRKGCKHNWQGSRKESTIWEINNRLALGDVSKMEEGTGHSTQKPLECMARPIRNNSAPGEGVYDPFLGSGTTLIAAESLGRICYGIEIDPGYCDIIVNRYIKYMLDNDKPYEIKLNGEEYCGNKP